MVGVIGLRIGLFISNLGGGGVQRVILNLAKGLLDEGYDVDLVVGWSEGMNKDFIPFGIKLIDLKKKNILACIPGLMKYLQKNKPGVLLTAQTHVNIAGIISMVFSGKKIRLVVCEHNNMKAVVKADQREWFRPLFARWLYPMADEIVAVSKGVADSLSEMTGIQRDKIRIIYNPLISDELIAKADEPILHPWFKNNSLKVILAAGRLEDQKDFSTLIRAFSMANKIKPFRLIILGDGRKREELQSLVDELGLHDSVDMPGFIENPYPFMKRASLFILSSKYEGFPGVLIEALACGVPVISTNCPSGPEEILANGKYGRLVPIGDVEGMASAIIYTIKDPPLVDLLVQRGMEFNIKKATKEYLKIFFKDVNF